MDTLVAKLQALLGPDAVLTGEAAKERGFSPWTRVGAPRAVVKPKSTEEVSGVIKLARADGAAVVPWGGLTGLVSGAAAEGAIALSLERMNAIESIDRLQGVMTVQAGCVLARACEAAEAEGLFLPLDLGARGSATIGGNISTNAGGNRVLRYGMMRDMVLGLEAVLADGTIVPALNHLMKNNTGIDLKQLFIGAEGTLGVVTRAVIRLRPSPAARETGFLAVPEFDALPQLLRALEADMGGGLSAFEVMWPEFYELVTTEPAKGRPILPHGSPFYVLTEMLGADAAQDAPRFERAITRAFEAGWVTDAVIAKSGAERDSMWALRDDVAQTARNGPMVAFDVSLPIARMQDYLAEVRDALAKRWTGARLVVFGHLGDGNLHLVAGVGDASARRAIEDIVYGPLQARQGSVSAEHGIGLQKRPYLALSRSPEELALMRLIKRSLDPTNTLNPGKIYELEPIAQPVAAQ
ncbi:MAG TPA: FAD-binding oxidoreductase [Caulobacteraceae bacterium]|nr:FAD-binding oxidoreductase [Caulobacteraceae bacterium]